MAIKQMEDAWIKAGWIRCPKCGVYFHPLHSYGTDGKHCTECTRVMNMKKTVKER